MPGIRVRVGESVHEPNVGIEDPTPLGDKRTLTFMVSMLPFGLRLERTWVGWDVYSMLAQQF